MKIDFFKTTKIITTFFLFFIFLFFISCDEKVIDNNPCKDVSCSNHGECAVDGDKPFCMCDSGYNKENNSCIFICNDNSSVNETNDGCILNPSCDDFLCNENEHCEMVENAPKCLCNGNSTFKDGKCVLNPTCEETTCGDFSSCRLIEGIPECICDNKYIKKDDSCIYDCTNDQFSKPNNNNNGCICIDNYILDDNDKCVFHSDPCADNPCADNNENKTLCVETQINNFECRCEDGYRENDQNICIELHSVHIRAVAGNVTSGSRQSYDLGHGIRIIQALKPDVIMLQEFKYNNDNEGSFNELTELMFQDPGCLTSEPKRCYYSTQGGNLPNAILSRYKVVESGFWDDPQIDNRELNYVRIDIPGEKDLWIISVHLATRTSKRVIASRAIIDGIRTDIPDDDYIILGGDFNTDTRGRDNDGTFLEETLNTLSEVFYLDGPHPTDRYEEEGTNASREKPYDWVLATPNLKESQVNTSYCDFELPDISALTVCNYPNGLVFDTRDFSSTDLTRYFSPSLTGDSSSNSMQHMAVVKDFEIIFN